MPSWEICQNIPETFHGIMGMFREWLFGQEMTAEYLNATLYEKTPDFLKEAFSIYPYSTDNILKRTGKETKQINLK